MQETAAKIQPLDVSDFSPVLLESVVTFTPEEGATMEMPQGYEIASTEWLPRERQKAKPPSAFKPTSIRDPVLPAALQKIDRWIDAAVEDLRRMHQIGRAAGRKISILRLGVCTEICAMLIVV